MERELGPSPAGALPTSVEADVPLGLRTTLELGGTARWLAEVHDAAELSEVLRWSRRHGIRTVVMGGGSNLVVADQGFDGLVVVPSVRGLDLAPKRDRVRVRVAAGESWDDVVARTVAEGLSGVECLSGIPGTAGATPIQNVGAYGQEVAEVVVSVRVLDRRTLEVVELGCEACRFGYRTSVFRREPDHHVVLEVVLQLSRTASPHLRYAELERRVAERYERPTTEDVRREVLALRRSKSMVLDDPDDPNRRSVGSFFVNPVVPREQLAELEQRALSAELVGSVGEVPRFDAGRGQVKIPAAWLIEAAGFPRGTRRGPVGLSSRHALALVHHGGGRTADLLAFAAEIRDAVRVRFGVTLQPEPVFLGFPSSDPVG